MRSVQSIAALPSGTILDGRYRIERVIGRGGFGITYEAVNVLTGQRTAIKEWTAGDQAGFLREARTLHDFAALDAVVTVLDYLEENGSAFLVMEYLDGITLREYVEREGRLPADTVVGLFRPIFAALEQIHGAGVIHRDISPDNLMVLGEGPDIRLTLMDFGAAKSYKGANVTHSVIYKPSYSPPEQMDPEGVMGSYTDVYALCGTIYFCITGKAPEDVVSRLLLDELVTPSALGVDIKPAAEKLLMQGLALDSEERIRDVSSLAKPLCEIYPDLTEEEKQAKKLRLQRRRRRLAAGAAAAFLIVLLLAFRHRIRLRFLFEDTILSTLDGSSLKESEFAKGAEIVKERVKVFSGGWYLWEEDPKQKEILFTVPAKLFGRTNPQDFIRMALTRPMVLNIYIEDEKSGKPIEFGVFDKKKDLSDVRKADDSLYVQFSDEAAARFDGLLEEKDRNVILCFDQETDEKAKSFFPYIKYTFKTAGDGRCIYQKASSDSEDADGIFVPDDLRSLHLTQDTFEGFFSVFTSFSVRWEDPGSAMIPGRMQRNIKELPDDTIRLRYPLYFVEDPLAETDQLYNSALLSLQAIIKNRLDAIGIPYATGVDVYDNNSLIFALPLEKLWYIEAEYLSDSIENHFGLGNQYASNNYYNAFSLKVEDRTDGSFLLLCEPRSYKLEEAKAVAKTVCAQGSDLYLYLGHVPIASCGSGEALASLEADGVIRFSKWALPSTEEMNSQTRHFAAFLETGCTQSPQKTVLSTSVRVEYPKEKLLSFLTSDRIRGLMPDFLPEDQTSLPLQWSERYDSSKCEISWSTVSPYEYTLTVNGCDLGNPQDSMAILRDIQEKDASRLRDKKIHKLTIYFHDTVVPDTDTGTVLVSYELDFQSLSLLRVSLYVSADDKEEEEALTDLWNKAAPEALVPLGDQ